MLSDPKREAQIAEEIFHASLEPWQRLLLRSAEEMRTRGFFTGFFVGQEGGVCMLGAMRFADGAAEGEVATGFWFMSDKVVYYQACEQLQSFLGMSVDTWNDAWADGLDDCTRVFHTVALG